jgi:hypothetical protein
MKAMAESLQVFQSCVLKKPLKLASPTFFTNEPLKASNHDLLISHFLPELNGWSCSGLGNTLSRPQDTFGYPNTATVGTELQRSSLRILPSFIASHPLYCLANVCLLPI